MSTEELFLLIVLSDYTLALRDVKKLLQQHIGKLRNHHPGEQLKKPVMHIRHFRMIKLFHRKLPDVAVPTSIFQQLIDDGNISCHATFKDYEQCGLLCLSKRNETFLQRYDITYERVEMVIAELNAYRSFISENFELVG